MDGATLTRAITPRDDSDSDRGWLNRAVCRDEDPELFFPVARSAAKEAREVAQRQTQLARQVCARCPAREPCLDDALTSGQDYGIWGGMDEEERRAISRRRVAANGRVGDDDSTVYTATQTATILDVSQDTLSSWARAGKIRVLGVINGRRMYSGGEIRRMIEKLGKEALMPVKDRGPIRAGEHRTGEPLTDFEIELLRAVAEGLEPAAVNARLGISGPDSAREHFRAIAKKLGARSWVNAVALAKQGGYRLFPVSDSPAAEVPSAFVLEPWVKGWAVVDAEDVCQSEFEAMRRCTRLSRTEGGRTFAVFALVDPRAVEAVGAG